MKLLAIDHNGIYIYPYRIVFKWNKNYLKLYKFARRKKSGIFIDSNLDLLLGKTNKSKVL